MASFSQNELSWGRLLSNLGYKDKEKYLNNRDLFVVPNKDAFQKIIHFLFIKLDKNKAENVFRDCWPIFDKKMEADFRRVCFTWYKELQVKNPVQLPSITASLFQSPGGRKFLNFKIKFIRFVTKEHIKSLSCSSSDDLWEPENLNGQESKVIGKGLIIENSETMKKEFQDFLTSADFCQSFVNVMSPVFRKYKAKLKEAQEQSNHHLMAIHNNPVDDLRNSCENLKEENLVLKEEFVIEYNEIVQQLNKIESIAGEKAVNYELNVDSYGIVDSDQDLSVVFEKFLTSIQDFNHSKARRTQGNIKYNHNHIEKHLKYVEKERLKLTDLQSHIENDLLKPLILKNLAQKSEKIDWKSLFEVQRHRQPLKDVDVLLPNTPGVKIQTSPFVKTTKFLLENNNSSEKSREMASSSLSNNITKPEPEIEEESKDEFSVSVKQSTPTVVNEIQVWSPEQSRISVFGDRIRLDSTPKTSRSRSPILKKVEENSTLPNHSGFSSIVEDNSIASFSLRTRPKNHSNVITDISSPTPGGHRFILSPSILERSPLMLTPPILSRISDISSPDLATYANTPGGKKLKSRLNELINTLGSSKAGETILSYSPGNDDSLLLSNATQPEFSHIDF